MDELKTALETGARGGSGQNTGTGKRAVRDIVLLASIGLAALVYGERGLWANAAAAALAFVAIRLVGAYRYDPGETAGVMTLRVIGAVAAAAALASLAHVAAALPIEALPAWAAIAGVLLTATHLGALVRIRSWRAQGRLTPNILVVGASSGIGLATAQLLHDGGATLYTASRHLSPELAALGTTHLTYDATQPVGSAFDTLPDVLHGLVYCPGSIKLRPFERVPVEDFRADFELNVLGAVQTLQGTITKWMTTHCSRAYSPSSRPIPDCL